MILSNAYKKDIISKNTKLIPLVIIEKYISEDLGTPENPNINYERIFLSTHNVQVDGHHFQPLLLQMPSLSQNLDLDSGRFQTSSLTLNVSNTDYNNSKRISDKLDKYNLLNAVVCIHYKTQSCTSLQLPNQDSNGMVNENTNTSFGCPRVFTGVIRKISHQLDTITFSIEDITDKRITRNLPNTKLDSTDNVPDKYKNAYVPMLYGSLENAPAVAEYNNGLFTVKADTMTINKVNEKEWGRDNYLYGGVSLYADEQYLGVTRRVHWEAIKEDEATATERFYDVNPDNPSQYNINDNGQVSFNYGSMLQIVNRIEVLKTGSPKTILLNQNEGVTIDHKEHEDNADVHIWEGYPEQHITNNNYKVATDGLMDTSFEKSLSSSLYWSNERQENITGAMASTLGVFYSLQWDSGISGADYVRVIQNKLNDTEMPVKGDANLPSGYGVWDDEFGAIWITNMQLPLLGDDSEDASGAPYMIYNFNPDRLFTMGELNTDLSDLISLGNDYTYTSNYLNANVNMYYNPNADIRATFSQEMIFTDTDVDGDGVTDAYNTPEIYPMIRLSSGNNTLPNAGQSWSSLEVVGSILNWTGGYNQTYGIHYRVNIAFDLDIKVEEIETTALAQFNKATDNEFYLNAEGRTDTFLSEYSHSWTLEGQTTEVTDIPEILENPADVIRHILVQECGLTNNQFDEDEFNTAWLSRQSHPYIGNPINLALSVNKLINSKEVLQKISQNSMIYPRFKNNGKMGFVTLQKAYYPEWDYNSATEIDITDIITYKFDLSRELISKIDVSYNYDYGQEKNLKSTDAKQMTQAELDWYGISNVEDAYLEYQADYIQDEASAIQLRDMIWYNRKANHLQIDLTLPLSYIDLEIGDLCKFPINKLIAGIKAHGINYTVFDNYGGVLRVPLFKVIKVNKTLESIRVTLHQLHWLDTQSNAISDMQSGLWDSIDMDNDLIDPLTLNFDSEAEDVFGEIEDPASGDVNLDGTLNILDVLTLTNFVAYANQDEMTETQFQNADTTGDGQVNVLDIITLVNMILENE